MHTATAIRTSVLSCGMTLVTEAMPSVRSAAVSWMLPAGAAHEPEDKQGLGAMWEELLLRGAGDLDARGFTDALDRLGVSRSVDTGSLWFSIGATLVADRLIALLPRLVDMVRRPRMDADAVAGARELALQSLASLADDPQERAVIRARERHIPLPLNRSGMGNEKGLRSITRDDLMDQWSRLARPEGSIFAVAGALAPNFHFEIARELDSLLTGWTGRAPEIVRKPSPTRGSYTHESDRKEQVQIVAMHDAPPEADPDSTAERLVNAVLSGGMSARLFTEVREKRALCYSVHASYGSNKDFARVLAYVGTTPERAQQSLDVLFAELQRINGTAASGGGVGMEELERARTGIISSLVFSGESTAARAGALAGDLYRLGRARPLAEVVEGFRSTTLDAVNAYLARRRLGPTTIVTVGPRALTPPGDSGVPGSGARGPG